MPDKLFAAVAHPHFHSTNNFRSVLDMAGDTQRRRRAAREVDTSDSDTDSATFKRKLATGKAKLARIMQRMDAQCARETQRATSPESSSLSSHSEPTSDSDSCPSVDARESQKKSTKSKKRKLKQSSRLSPRRSGNRTARSESDDLQRGSLKRRRVSTSRYSSQDGRADRPKASLRSRAMPQDTSTADISAALAEAPREVARPPPTGFGAQARYDFVVFGSRYGATKECQLNLCKVAFLDKSPCSKHIDCPYVHKWPSFEKMKYLATQESEVGRRAFADFCADFHANWLANWNKYYKYHDREEPDPALPVGRWLKADSHDKVGIPYHGNNKTAQQKNNRTSKAYGRLNTSQGTQSDRHENDHTTAQFRNRMRGLENNRSREQDQNRFAGHNNNRNSEQDTNRVTTQQNYNVSNVSKITRPKGIRWAEPPQEDEPYIKQEEE